MGIRARRRRIGAEILPGGRADRVPAADGPGSRRPGARRKRRTRTAPTARPSGVGGGFLLPTTVASAGSVAASGRPRRPAGPGSSGPAVRRGAVVANPTEAGGVGIEPGGSADRVLGVRGRVKGGRRTRGAIRPERRRSHDRPASGEVPPAAAPAGLRRGVRASAAPGEPGIEGRGPAPSGGMRESDRAGDLARRRAEPRPRRPGPGRRGNDSSRTRCAALRAGVRCSARRSRIGAAPVGSVAESGRPANPGSGDPAPRGGAERANPPDGPPDSHGSPWSEGLQSGPGAASAASPRPPGSGPSVGAAFAGASRG